MDVNILIQRLQGGEVTTQISAEGEPHTVRQSPTSTALQAARALQQLMQLHESNQRVIQQLIKDNESLHEQVQLLQSNNANQQNS